MAIVEFEDMECPDCANANPLLREAAAKYNIPWVRHDFPLPFHPWSIQAAVNARWFDTKSKKMGDEYRDAVFAAQPLHRDLDGLRQFTEKFAQSHNIRCPLPSTPRASSRPRSRLTTRSASASASSTPPPSGSPPPTKGAPFVEVVDRSKLFQLIDQAIADTRSATPEKTAHK